MTGLGRFCREGVTRARLDRSFAEVRAVVDRACGRCHGDEKLMKRYGLSTAVVSTYLADFHGMSATLQHGQKKADGKRLAAVCTDCHGVHDIQKSSDPTSATMSANLQKTCAKCHQGATASFPKAWLSHYEPSVEKAPLVWLVQL